MMKSKGQCLVWFRGTEVLVYVQYGCATRTLQRPLNEPIEKPLGRLCKSIASKGTTCSVELRNQEGINIPSNVINEEAWRAVRHLKVNEQSQGAAGTETLIEVVHEPTRVVSVNIQKKNLYVGCIILSEVVIEGAEADYKVRWERVPVPEKKSGGGKQKGKAVTGTTEQHVDPIVVSTDKNYTPTEEDIGSGLQFTITPLYGCEVSATTTQAVQEFPCSEATLCPLQLVAHSPLTEPDEFRVVSYNILADTYASMEVVKKEWYPYTGEQFLDIDYRKHVLLRELKSLNADVLCLQEVGRSLYHNFLVPLLGGVGYEGILDEKLAGAEGSAIFWKTEHFKKEGHHRIVFKEIPTTSFPTLDDFELLKEAWQKLPSIAQVVLLRDTRNNHLTTFANTHLFFHPSAPNMRILQMYSILNKMQEIERSLGEKVYKVLCGDCNMLVGCGAYKLVTEGKVGEQNRDWITGCDFKWGKDEEFLNFEKSIADKQAPETYYHPSVESPFTEKMASAYVSCNGKEPPATNVTTGFTAPLDYIFHCESLRAMKAYDPPDVEKVLKAFTALPSRVFCSDHVNICADFKYV